MQECDDGNVLPGDGCSELCKLEAGWRCDGRTCGKDTCRPMCGDGRKDYSESCDDGNDRGFDGCAPFCALERGYEAYGSVVGSVCGDGIWAGAEV